jgi:thiol-disulfide isomerase/thioredoxin
MKRIIMLLGVIALVGCAASADEVAVGTKAPAFALKNAVDGKTVSLRAADAPVSVVVFTCNECPYAKAFEPRIIAIAKEYQAKGVVFYAIDSNDETRFEEEALPNM